MINTRNIQPQRTTHTTHHLYYQPNPKHIAQLKNNFINKPTLIDQTTQEYSTNIQKGCSNKISTLFIKYYITISHKFHTSQPLHFALPQPTPTIGIKSIANFLSNCQNLIQTSNEHGNFYKFLIQTPISINLLQTPSKPPTQNLNQILIFHPKANLL